MDSCVKTGKSPFGATVWAQGAQRPSPLTLSRRERGQEGIRYNTSASALQRLDEAPDGAVAQLIPECWTTLPYQLQLLHERVPVLLIRGVQLRYVFHQALAQGFR